MAEHATGEHVYAEQVRQLYRLSRPAYVGSLINASILVFALSGVVSTTRLGAWLCVMFMVTAGRYLLYRSFLGANPPDGETRGWARRFVLGAGCAGLMWGLAGAALYPVSSLPHQFLEAHRIHGFLTEEQAPIFPVGQRHRHLDPLSGDLLSAARHRQIDVDAALNHRRRHHEDDQQHEHDIDERHDVDLGERDADAASASQPSRSRIRRRVNLRHIVRSA